jgi:lipopolysaccharide/colanic/teichoic acid biosynthesis glycosyltransferase
VRSTYLQEARVKDLVDVLLERVRFTDEVGWIGDRQIGVLLPETDPQGAVIFADRVRYVMMEQGEPPTYRLHVYPQDRSDKDEDNDNQLWFDGMGPDNLSDGNDQASDLLNPTDATPSVNRAEAATSASETLTGRDVGSIEGLLRVPLPFWKRLFDILLSGAALVVLAPLMLLVALLIKCVSRGPILFRQERVGYMGNKFACLKFRTMHADNDASEHRKHLEGLINSREPMTKLDQKRDPRIIPAGKVLRQAAIDELPQLINVLRGDMSLVGPRPCIPYEYSSYRDWQRNRVDAVPGMTGLWQVSGKNRLTFEEMMRLDIIYARRMSPWLDILIILRTPLAILQQVQDGRKVKEAASHSFRYA